ncbi:hypothetical protein CASFOL_007696 [Castilleja foliolosa]|uniref:DNA-directed RNA polymerase n=1 Tax=Castilleja foliolosa TaxID=1961234 RepID=A0ABD3E2N3_9LAMI
MNSTEFPLLDRTAEISVISTTLNLINGKFKMLGDENEAMSTIPGFNQIQFEGFCRFIDQGLTEEKDLGYRYKPIY